jgi:AbiV family abortive infection protein
MFVVKIPSRKVFQDTTRVHLIRLLDIPDQRFKKPFPEFWNPLRRVDRAFLHRCPFPRRFASSQRPVHEVRQFFEHPTRFGRLFFSVTLIEEVGEVVILVRAELAGRLDQKAFYNHNSKYRYAVYDTLLVNSRVSRVYGDDEAKFAEWFRTDKLFVLRNSALYLNLRDADLVVPEQVVDRGDALLLVSIAGEILAEIQGSAGPEQWLQILSEVDQFRALAGAGSVKR